MSTEHTQPARAELLPIELLASLAKLEAAGGILLLVSTIVALEKMSRKGQLALANDTPEQN
jgi:hypothetical protein